MFFYFNFGKRKQIEEALMPWMIMFGQSSEVTVAHMFPKSQCVVSWLSPKGFVSSGISNDSYKIFYLWGKWDKFDKLKAFQSKKNTLQFSYCTVIVLILIPIPHICHFFSTYTIFGSIFSMQKRLNHDKTDYAENSVNCHKTDFTTKNRENFRFLHICHV